MYRIYVSGALYLGVLFSVANGQSCSEDKVRKCISIAEPMLKDPHLIFPDNMNDINNVCRTWSNFVDCIRRYIDKCFSKVRKDQFNTAVEPPIASVHQMCSVSSYQSEYLEYAGCIKATVIEPEHCGGHYSSLVHEVSLENVRKPNLCCAYHNFRSCVILKTRLRCDANQLEGIAARFSRQVLDKAFRFLQDQCLNYVADTGECATMPMGEARIASQRNVDRGASARAVHRGRQPSASSSQYPELNGSSLQVPVTSAKLNDEPAPPPPRAEEEASAGRKHAEASQFTPDASIVDNSVPMATATQRSSSYGRGISWTVQATTSATPASSTSEIPDWATNAWLTHAQDLTTEEIYPAAGSFGGNNIDEPNQQGLSRNQQPSLRSSAASTLLLLLLLLTLLTN